MKISLELPEGIYADFINAELSKTNPDIWKLFLLCLDRAKELFDLNGDHFPFLFAARFFELLGYKNIESQKVEIFTCQEGSCDKCKSQHGKIYDLMKALEIMPIPHKDCTTFCDPPGEFHSTGWCRCIWQPVIED